MGLLVHNVPGPVKPPIRQPMSPCAQQRYARLRPHPELAFGGPGPSGLCASSTIRRTIPRAGVVETPAAVRGRCGDSPECARQKTSGRVLLVIPVLPLQRVSGVGASLRARAGRRARAVCGCSSHHGNAARLDVGERRTTHGSQGSCIVLPDTRSDVFGGQAAVHAPRRSSSCSTRRT